MFSKEWSTWRWWYPGKSFFWDAFNVLTATCSSTSCCETVQRLTSIERSKDPHQSTWASVVNYMTGAASSNSPQAMASFSCSTAWKQICNEVDICWHYWTLISIKSPIYRCWHNGPFRVPISGSQPAYYLYEGAQPKCVQLAMYRVTHTHKQQPIEGPTGKQVAKYNFSAKCHSGNACWQSCILIKTWQDHNQSHDANDVNFASHVQGPFKVICVSNDLMLYSRKVGTYCNPLTKPGRLQRKLVVSKWTKKRRANKEGRRGTPIILLSLALKLRRIKLLERVIQKPWSHPQHQDTFATWNYYQGQLENRVGRPWSSYAQETMKITGNSPYNLYPIWNKAKNKRKLKRNENCNTWHGTKQNVSFWWCFFLDFIARCDFVAKWPIEKATFTRRRSLTKSMPWTQTQVLPHFGSFGGWHPWLVPG